MISRLPISPLLILAACTAIFSACSSGSEEGSDNDAGASTGGSTEASGGDSGEGSGGDMGATGGETASGGDDPGMGGASTGGADAGTGGSDAGTGGQASQESFRLDLNFYLLGSCDGMPGYTMGSSFESGTCYTGAEVKQSIEDASPGMPLQAALLLDQAFPDSGYFTLACDGSPSLSSYSDDSCSTLVETTNADSCAFLVNTGMVTVHSQQSCTLE